MDSASHYNFLVSEFVDIAVQLVLGSEQSYDSTNDSSADECNNYCDDHAEQLCADISCNNDGRKSSEESGHTVEIVNSACICTADKLLYFRSDDAVAYSTEDSSCNTYEH